MLILCIIVYKRLSEVSKIMIVYHGSNMIVEKPVLIHPNRALDFGNGFYTTINIEQAQSFANNVVDRNNGEGTPTVSCYEIDYDKILQELNILKFDNPNEKWLDFVYECRMAKYIGEQYDIIIGPVANDTLYRVFRQYESGDIDRETTIKKLKVTELYNQMTFCTEKAIEALKFIKSEVFGNG